MLGLLCMVLASTPINASIRGGGLSTSFSGGGEGATPVIVRFATSTGAGMSAECANQQIAGTNGETFTTARSSLTSCIKADGTLVSISTNTPSIQLQGSYKAVHLDIFSRNYVLQNRDCTQAAWTLTSGTCAKTATGVTGVANSASTFTATGANATMLQTLSFVSATHATSVYVKRRTGSGAIELTRDNGSTWIAITGSVTGGAFFRATPADFAGLSTTSANPTVGLRLATSGDEIDVDYFQDEGGLGNLDYTSPAIATAGSVVTRSTSQHNMAWPIAAASSFSVSMDSCAETANKILGYVVGTGSLDFAGTYFDNSLGGWFCKTTNNMQSAYQADTVGVGTCRRIVMQWNETTLKCSLSVYALTAIGGAAGSQVGVTAASTPADVSISTATQLAIGYAPTSGQTVAENLVGNGCFTNSLLGCP